MSQGIAIQAANKVLAQEGERGAAPLAAMLRLIDSEGLQRELDVRASQLRFNEQTLSAEGEFDPKGHPISPFAECAAEVGWNTYTQLLVVVGFVVENQLGDILLAGASVCDRTGLHH